MLSFVSCNKNFIFPNFTIDKLQLFSLHYGCAVEDNICKFMLDKDFLSNNFSNTKRFYMKCEPAFFAYSRPA